VPAPVASRVRANGLEFQLYEWPGAGPAVLFAHATGFHARCWDQVVANLPGYRCLALDMRGHGRSEKPAPPYPWRQFGEDVAAVARAIGLAGAVGVGHSKGGYAVTYAAAKEPSVFASLLLVDPVILPRNIERQPREGEHFAVRRRNEWASPDEMFQRFHDRPPFKSWQPAVLRDYCEYGPLPNPDGPGYVLACPPEMEAATYAGAIDSHDIYAEIDRVICPVRVLRAKQRDPGAMGMGGSPTAPDLATHFARGEDVYLPQYSHYMPMEAPELIAHHIRELAVKS
jgi:pimeloyl-ACP methyl ester carboxylesterase